MEKQRTGLFGGSFDPIHTGHLILAQDAIDLFELDNVIFVPCYIPAHKNPKKLASYDHRMTMVNHAIEHDLRFSVSDLEQQLGGTSYAIDTIRHLQKENPDTDYHFIIGADTLLELHTWYQVYDLLQRCSFIVLGRPYYNFQETGCVQLKMPWRERLLSQCREAHQIEISATDIRNRVAEGMRIDYLVPSAVDMYIAEHNLYLS